MKTAISIPDRVFNRAEKIARSKGMSRSELYVAAIHEYIEKNCRDEIKKKLDDFYATQKNDFGISGKLAGKRLVDKGLWEW